jgi:hypothetical protein
MLYPPVLPAVPGGPATFAPRFQALSAGPAQYVAAGPAGVQMGVFGWADPGTGTVSNSPQSAGDALGIVLNQYADWGRVYYQAVAAAGLPGYFLRPGLPVTVAIQGEFWLCFAAGCQPGQPVYASRLDGSPTTTPGALWYANSTLVPANSILYSANGGTADLTPFQTATGCNPGGLAIVTSYGVYHG